MDFFDIENNLILYLVLIILFIAFFFWNNSRLKKNRTHRRDRNFKIRYTEKRKELEKQKKQGE